MSSKRPLALVVLLLCCAPWAIFAESPPRAVQVTAIWLGGNGNWNTPLAWSTGVVPSNNAATTYDVRIDNSNPLASSVAVNMSPTIDKLTIDSGETLQILNGNQFSVMGGAGAGTIVNAGTIQVSSTGGTTIMLGNSGDVSITGGGTIAMGNNTNNRLYQTGSGTLSNVDNTIRGAGQIGVNSLSYVNQGTIIADQPTSLTLDPGGTFTNSGSLRAESGATLRLLSGNFPNVGGVIEARDGSVVELNTVTVSGGTLQTIGTGEVRSFNSTLSGSPDTVTSTGSLVVPNGQDLSFTGTLTNGGTIRLNSTGNTTNLIGTGGDVSLTGGGTVLMSNNTPNRIYQSGSGTFSNVNNTIRGAGQIGVNNLSYVNQGTIVADQPALLTLDPGGTFTNTGTLRAEAGATLRLYPGSFANAGGIIEARDGSIVELSTTTVSGGTLQTIGTGEVRSFSSTLSGSPDTVTSTGSLVVPNGHDLSFTGTLINTGTIRLNSAGGTTNLIGTGGDVLLTGGGTVLMSNSTLNRIYQSVSSTFTNVNNTIRGAGQIGVNFLSYVNQGAIVADQSAALTLDPGGTFTNTGTLRAEAGATLRLYPGSFANAGGIIEARDGSIVELSTTTVLGGTLQTAGSGEVRSHSSTLNGSPDAVTSTGSLVVPNGLDLSFTGTLINTGTIRLNSAGGTTSMLGTGGDVLLTGGGTVLMSNNTLNRIYQSGSGTFTNVNNTIRGGGQIAINSLPFVNQGTIIADQPVALTIDPDSIVGVSNPGTLLVTGSGGMSIVTGPFVTSGTVTIDATRTLTRTGNYDQTGGTTTVNGSLTAGAINIQSGVLTGAGTVNGPVTNAGTVAPGTSIGTLTCSGTFVQSIGGTVHVELAGLTAGTQYDRLAITGAATLAGTLRVTIVEPFVPQIGDVFTVMTFASRSGTFLTYDAPCLLAEGKRFRVDYAATSVTLKVVAAANDLTDMNCNCVYEPEDYAAFVLALTQPAAYVAAYPACDILRGDMNGDGFVNGADIQGFTAQTALP